MNHLIVIAAGGAIWALLRFGISTFVYARLGRDFPYGTLVVNVLGCLAMGFLYVLLLDRVTSGQWRAAVLIGLLGAFTTFSTFSLETLNLLESGAPTKALFNIFLSVGLGLLATWLGILMARQL